MPVGVGHQNSAREQARRESEVAPCNRIAAMKRNEAQLHTERARIAEDLEEAHERLAAEVAAQARGPRFMVGFLKRLARRERVVDVEGGAGAPGRCGACEGARPRVFADGRVWRRRAASL